MEGLGQLWFFYFGLAAAAPTTPADETQTAYNKIGEIPGTISISRSRNFVDRRTRDDPNARYVHAGERTETISFTMNFDGTGNTGYDDLKTAYNSDADGVGASGTLGYFNITDAVSGNHQWYGEGGVSDLSLEVTNAEGIMSVNVTLEVNKDMTDVAHA